MTSRRLLTADQPCVPCYYRMTIIDGDNQTAVPVIIQYYIDILDGRVILTIYS